MKYSVKHGLPNRKQVRTCVGRAYESYEVRLSEYKPALRWEAEDRATISFTVMSQTIKAAVHFDEEELHIDGKVPFLFKPFEKKIEGVLSSEMEKWLAKARAGEL